MKVTLAFIVGTLLSAIVCVGFAPSSEVSFSSNGILSNAELKCVAVKATGKYINISNNTFVNDGCYYGFLRHYAGLN